AAGLVGSLPNIRPSATFSRVVAPGRTRTSWNVRAMRARHISNDRTPMISSPWRTIDPASGGSSPVMRLRTVVLPEPFGPMRPVMPPAGISKERSRTATRPPKAFLRPWTLSRAPGGGAAPTGDRAYFRVRLVVRLGRVFRRLQRRRSARRAAGGSAHAGEHAEQLLDP